MTPPAVAPVPARGDTPAAAAAAEAAAAAAAEAAAAAAAVPAVPAVPAVLAVLRSANAGTYIEDVELGRKLGKGASGEVYVGVWGGTTEIALKKLTATDCENQRTDFENESRLLQTLRHPNVVQFLGLFIGEEENSVEIRFIATEFMHDGSLLDLLEVGGKWVESGYSFV
jgi:Protein tyrosine and serine/threonine kinase